MSRWQAAGIHLGISALIAALLMGVMYVLWYPAPYFNAMGGSQLVLLLVGVDVVIGPLITLIIYKAGKKGLKFDFAVIAFLQSAALVYGVIVAAEARPVYSVFVVDRFEVVAANMLDPQEIAKAKRDEFRSLPWFGPRVVGAVKPTDANEQFRIMFAITEGKDLQHFPQQYVPYSDVADEAGRRVQPIETLRRFNKERGAEIDEFLNRHGVTEKDIGFVPMRARRGELATILRKNGEIVGTLNLSPWGN